MPVYEYRCRKCKRRFSILWRTFSLAEEGVATCTHCGSQDVQRLISRVRVLHSEERRLDDMADPSSWGDLDENDPKSMGRFMRKMMNEIGDEAGDIGPEFEEVVDRLESGQTPEQIEEDVPSLAEGLEDSMDMGGDL